LILVRATTKTAHVKMYMSFVLLIIVCVLV